MRIICPILLRFIDHLCFECDRSGSKSWLIASGISRFQRETYDSRSRNLTQWLIQLRDSTNQYQHCGSQIKCKTLPVIRNYNTDNTIANHRDVVLRIRNILSLSSVTFLRPSFLFSFTFLFTVCNILFFRYPVVEFLKSMKCARANI